MLTAVNNTMVINKKVSETYNYLVLQATFFIKICWN